MFFSEHSVQVAGATVSCVYYIAPSTAGEVLFLVASVLMMFVSL